MHAIPSGHSSSMLAVGQLQQKSYPCITRRNKCASEFEATRAVMGEREAVLVSSALGSCLGLGRVPGLAGASMLLLVPEVIGEGESL
jgi:hypothetical protein